MEAWRILNDGRRVILDLQDGRPAKGIPWQVAIEVAHAMIANARLVEENEKALQVIHDAAIMARAGVPIGLTSDPRKQDRARLEAVHNRELRRSNLPKPGGVPSQEVFGTPIVVPSPSMAQIMEWKRCQN